MNRNNGRANDQLRSVSMQRKFTSHAAGSVLIKTGDTHVLCTASIEDRVPFHIRNTNQGWVTGEYSLLPGSTIVRSTREATRGKQGGRTMEIQRLIGRSLRSCVDLTKIGERSIIVDCDVLQADGGTRCASITGGFLALMDAINHLVESGEIQENPIKYHVASVAVGLVQGEVVLDLDYSEDFGADVDMNFVGNEFGEFIEVQGTAENGAFSENHLKEMAAIAKAGIQSLIEEQKSALKSV